MQGRGRRGGRGSGAESFGYAQDLRGAERAERGFFRSSYSGTGLSRVKFSTLPPSLPSVNL